MSGPQGGMAGPPPQTQSLLANLTPEQRQQFQRLMTLTPEQVFRAPRLCLSRLVFVSTALALARSNTGKRLEERRPVRATPAGTARAARPLLSVARQPNASRLVLEYLKWQCSTADDSCCPHALPRAPQDRTPGNAAQREAAGVGSSSRDSRRPMRAPHACVWDYRYPAGRRGPEGRGGGRQEH